MKNNFITLLLLLSNIIQAQTKEEVEASVWPKNDPYSSVVKIPEKWKKESAVIIIKDERYSFDTSMMINNSYMSVRKRVMLLDQAAVKEFSEFSITERIKYKVVIMFGSHEKKERDLMGIKVIKPDGTEKRINVDEVSVKADDKIKIAVPNLEPGDIIDYYYYTNVPPVAIEERLLADEYPIMNAKITLDTEDNFFINFNSYNGAPKIKSVPEKGKKLKYELVASDIEKYEPKRWYYPFAELPAYKFHAVQKQTGNYAKLADAFVDNVKELKKTVSKEDVLKFYDNKLWALGNIGEVKKYIKQKGYTSTEEKVVQAYYFYRHMYFTRYMEALLASEAKIFDGTELYGNAPIFLDDEYKFGRHMMAFLKENKIKYEIIVATGRENGDIKDLLIQPNVLVGIKVLTDQPIYLQYFGMYNTPGTINYSIEGTDGYALQTPNFVKGTAVKDTKLPVSSYKDNKITNIATVKLNDDFNGFHFQKESLVYGQFKEGEQKEKLNFTDFIDQDNERYGTKPLKDLISNNKKKEQFIREYNALKTKIKDKQKKEFEESTEAEYGFDIDNHSFTFVDFGRYDKLQPFAYNENFTVNNNLIKSAGSNYVIEIGKFIGEQLKLDEKEMNRKENIYSIFPRSYDEQVMLTIPDGYTVSGIDKLNKKVENNTGGFISTASIEGNQLKIKAYKYYANYFEPTSNWKDMTAFLEAAYQFTQEKILLKKI